MRDAGTASTPDGRTHASDLDGVAHEVASLDVDNVYVYVADAVRWDALPRTVRETGAVARTVAASIHSPSSFASLLTGLAVPSHGVLDFDYRVSDSTFRLLDLAGYETRFVNTIGDAGAEDPLISVLDVDDGHHTDPFASCAEPFVVVERSQGGHAPYGGYDGTAPEYFAARAGATADELRAEYLAGVRADGERFVDRLADLEARGLLDDTLVVYTSDHGELLGEGGLFGHNAPVRPELVSVPTVLVHRDVTPGRLDGLLRHEDVVPTALSALDADVDVRFDGSPVTDGGLADAGCCFYRSRYDFADRLSFELRYDSYWEADGGHVFPRSPASSRLLATTVDALVGPQRRQVRRTVHRTVRSYASGTRTYGDPEAAVDHADRVVREWGAASPEAAARTDLSGAAGERLKELGYLE